MHPINKKFDAVTTSSASYLRTTVTFQASKLNFDSGVMMASFQVRAVSQERLL